MSPKEKAFREKIRGIKVSRSQIRRIRVQMGLDPGIPEDLA